MDDGLISSCPNQHPGPNAVEVRPNDVVKGGHWRMEIAHSKAPFAAVARLRSICHCLNPQGWDSAAAHRLPEPMGTPPGCIISPRLIFGDVAGAPAPGSVAACERWQRTPSRFRRDIRRRSQFHCQRPCRCLIVPALRFEHSIQGQTASLRQPFMASLMRGCNRLPVARQVHPRTCPSRMPPSLGQRKPPG
jgi:hypothetical protein